MVSLNEKKRLDEKAQDTSRVDTRKKERASRKPSPQKQYEITLKNADQPGLPAPVTVASATQTNAVEDVDADIENPDLPKAVKDQTADATLEEAKHILVDYIGVLKDGADASVARRSASVPAVNF